MAVKVVCPGLCDGDQIMAAPMKLILKRFQENRNKLQIFVVQLTMVAVRSFFQDKFLFHPATLGSHSVCH